MLPGTVFCETLRQLWMARQRWRSLRNGMNLGFWILSVLKAVIGARDD